MFRPARDPPRRHSSLWGPRLFPRPFGRTRSKRFARFSEIVSADEPPEKSVQLIVRGTLAALPLEGVIDFAAEKARLAKEIAKLKSEAGKMKPSSAMRISSARAPEEVVEENRERLAEALARAEKLEAAAARLG